ncbi:ABC transporter, ATP-binding protein [Gardnerella vaginalis JCP7276]|nr:ABC transporter, ATP-binding protein [Gardnerella vaginalis JCP7276]
MKIFRLKHYFKEWVQMAIDAQGLTIQIGARTLLNPTDFHVTKGDKIGLVGRNGAGKTTLTRVITGEMLPAGGTVRVSGGLGYLPQDTHAADPEQSALDRIMSARDISSIVSRIRKAEKEMTNPDPDIMTKAMNRYDKAIEDFEKAGGYAVQSEAISMANSLGLPQEIMKQALGTLSGGQRRRIELARILFSDADTLILDEPTNHLDADSIIWLRNYLKKFSGGFLVISHSTELLDEVVNKVWHLDAQLAQIDMYSMGWKAYLHQRVVDEERRRREREVAEKKAERLMKQGIRLHAKATKAVAAQNMMRRAERLLSETSEAQSREKVADIRFPEPAPCGRTPIMAEDISKAYGSNIVFAGINLAIDKGSRVVILGYNGAGKTTTLRILAGEESADTGSVNYGHGCKIGYFAQEHDTLDLDATVLENLQHVAPDLNDTQARSMLGSFLFSGDDAMKPAKVLSGGEKTRLALATLVTSKANVLLLDEPTNNLDPASRDEILKAIAKYEGAIVLVTHDEGAVLALNPERVLLMPDGDEDLWSDDYLDLVAEE